MAGSCRNRLRSCVAVGAVLIAFDAFAARAIAVAPQVTRPRIGLALGGGSARGLAHVGVLRWFDEHHVPIDVIAGTSMGGLVGGAFASGMTPDELSALLASTDWDAMFDPWSFRYKNVRRKRDARMYPSRIEFGLKRGIVPPLALNNGQRVNFLLARIAGAYPSLNSFDELPTPFRCLAVDLVSAQSIVLDHGVLAEAMRATMSLPGVFPPIEADGRVLVDGGALNNVPADVVRDMGADIVIAVNVGVMGNAKSVNYSLLGMMSSTIDAMMRANTRVAMQHADIVINPPLDEFDSLDWRRSDELAEQGYRATDALREQLLPLALGETAWAAYLNERRVRRRVQLPVPTSLTIVGAASSDERRMRRELEPLLGQPLDVTRLETDLESFAGLDRYETVDWRVREDAGRYDLEISARAKTYAPPFLMLGVGLENTTASAFAFELAGRYLALDTLWSGSEIRLDAAVGTQSRLGIDLYQPLGASRLFVGGSALLSRDTIDFVGDEVIVAEYKRNRALVSVDGGVSLGREDEVRASMIVGHLGSSVAVGDPGLPDLDGKDTRARLRWTHDGQDSPVVPSHGAHITGDLEHIFESPDVPASFASDRSNADLTQAEILYSSFWPARRRDRTFVIAGIGTSFGGHPLATEQFQIGPALHLGAHEIGDVRGDHYALVTAGYLKGVGRLPDFLGGPVYAGGWLENGSAFDHLETAQLHTAVGAGLILDTLIGPVVVGGRVGFDGDQRYFIAIGRVF